MRSNLNRTSILLIALLLFSVIFLLAGLGSNMLIDWDENIYAEASRQMMVRGDYLNIVINNEKFAEKPPFFFWEQVLSFKLFGINEFAARLPSAVAGILMVLLCFFIGAKIRSPRVGLIWGIVFLTCLIPSSLARASAIDHTFNLFITSAAFFLYLFDRKYQVYLDQKEKNRSGFSSFNHLAYLTAGSICLGLAFLTKSPLGSVIALVAFGGFKLFNRKPAVRMGHFLFCAVLSLSVALSWYVANWVVSGGDFIAEFIQFQLNVFSKPLQGHQGPFYYHFVIAFFGLIPWTAFLFSFKMDKVFAVNSHFKPLFSLCLAWITFVLVITAFVSTKLPHYSASVYIPFSLLIAMSLHQKMESREKLPKWVIVLYGILGCGLAVLTMVVPKLADEFLRRKQIVFSFSWPNGLYVAGAIMIIVCLVGVLLFWKNKLKAGIVATALLMLVFTQSLWQFLMPPFLSYNQQPLLEMVDESYQRGGKVVLYRFISFAALFYGKRPIDMLHTDKFNADPAMLNKRYSHDLFVVSDISYKKRLLNDYPLVEHIRDKGTFSYFIIKKE
ncbi:glycosyltransferase family 39 protein [bacterium]|nr:glycosyltransferase family 39 protein [bacterium]